MLQNLRFMGADFFPYYKFKLLCETAKSRRDIVRPERHDAPAPEHAGHTDSDADAEHQRQDMKTPNPGLQMSGRTGTTRCTAACSGSFCMEGSPAREAERGPSGLTQRRQMTLKSQ